jgi:hypothetical protein
MAEIARNWYSTETISCEYHENLQYDDIPEHIRETTRQLCVCSRAAHCIGQMQLGFWEEHPEVLDGDPDMVRERTKSSAITNVCKYLETRVVSNVNGLFNYLIVSFRVHPGFSAKQSIVSQAEGH